jgi:hypothetical protein
LKLLSTKNQVSFSSKELFENHQETLEKSKMDEEFTISPIQAQEDNARNESSDSPIQEL